MHTITQEEYLQAGQIFHWATQTQYLLWLTGKNERHYRTERMLPRLVDKKMLITREYGKKLVYAVPRMKNTPLIHGLGVTETIVRIMRSEDDGTYIQERFFKGFGSVPDWGVVYGEKLLAVEFSTKNNFEGSRIMKTKLTKYEKNLPKILKHFGAAGGLVLFVVNVSRERLKCFIKRNPHTGPYFFVDLVTFRSVPFGQQLTTPIYLWGDGESYPLKND